MSRHSSGIRSPRWRRCGAALAAAAAIALLAGCTGAADDESVAPEPTTSSRTKVTDAPTTPEQWWAVAQREKAQWDAWTDTWDSASCGAIDALESAGIDCALLVYSAVEMTSFSEQTWMGLTTPGSPEFISTRPPEDIADLVAQTQSAVSRAAASGTPWMDAQCGFEQTPDCVGLATTLGDDLAAMDTRLAAWGERLS